MSGCRRDWHAPGAGYGVALWSFGGGKGLGEKAGKESALCREKMRGVENWIMVVTQNNQGKIVSWLLVVWNLSLFKFLCRNFLKSTAFSNKPRVSEALG